MKLLLFLVFNACVLHAESSVGLSEQLPEWEKSILVRGFNLIQNHRQAAIGTVLTTLVATYLSSEISQAETFPWMANILVESGLALSKEAAYYLLYDSLLHLTPALPGGATGDAKKDTISIALGLASVMRILLQELGILGGSSTEALKFGRRLISFYRLADFLNGRHGFSRRSVPPRRSISHLSSSSAHY